MTNAEATQRQYRTIEVAIDDLIPGPFNPRKVDPKDPGLADLAQSIKECGLLQPLVVREHPKKKDKYEILAGERRFHALQLAGIPKARVSVCDLDDVEAGAVTVVENLQREAVPPMQEAKAIASLLKKHKGDTETVASVLGMHRSTVARRAKLLELTDKWKKAVENNRSPVCDWPPAMLELVSRYDADVQDRLLKDIEDREHWRARDWDRNDLAKYLAVKMQDLRNAPWDVNDAGLLPKAGACVSCPKRSDRQNDLFSDDDTPKNLAADARCLDPDCWQKKLLAHLPLREAELRKEHDCLVLILSKDGYSYLDQKLIYKFDQAMRKSAFESCPKADKNAMPAMYVDGAQIGKLAWVKERKQSSYSTGSRAKAKGSVTSLAERRKVLDARRKALAVKELHELLGDDQYKVCPIRDLPMMLALARTLGLDLRADVKDWWKLADRDDWKQIDQLMHQDPAGDESLDDLWRMVRPHLMNRVFYQGLATIDRQFAEAKKVAELLCIDFDLIYSEAIEAIPEPAGWANLKADGTPKVSKPVAKKKKPRRENQADPGKCRVCGCTEDQACMTDDGPCHWADESQTLCSGCAESEGAAA